jgi:hypothetical protein
VLMRRHLVLNLALGIGSRTILSSEAFRNFGGCDHVLFAGLAGCDRGSLISSLLVALIS